MDEQRARWFETLFSTEPADRDSAEAGIRTYYQAAELDRPRQILWLNSPAEACYATLLLCSHHDPFMRRIAEAFAKLPGPRAEMVRIREKFCQALDIVNWNVAGPAMGPPLAGTGSPARHNVRGKITLARIALWQDPSAAMGKLTEDDLFQAEGRFWTVVVQALQTQGTMLSRSVSRMYHLAWMAMGEAKVGDAAPPPQLPALWKVARSAGPWWPFLNGAIATERPLEIHRTKNWLLERGDGPAIRYRDGWKVFAWGGYPFPEKWIMRPESISASQLKQAGASFRAYLATRGITLAAVKKSSLQPSVVLKADLPSDPVERVEFFRKTNGGRLPYYDRYQSVERREVWSETGEVGRCGSDRPLRSRRSSCCL